MAFFYGAAHPCLQRDRSPAKARSRPPKEERRDVGRSSDITDLQKKTCRRQWREIAEEKSEWGYYSHPPFQHFPCRVQNQEKICLERKVSSPALSFMMYHIRRFASLKTDLSAAFLTGVRLCLPCTRIDISCDAMGREVNFVWQYTGFGEIAVPRLRKCCRQL